MGDAALIVVYVVKVVTKPLSEFTIQCLERVFYYGPDQGDASVSVSQPCVTGSLTKVEGR